MNHKELSVSKRPKLSINEKCAGIHNLKLEKGNCCLISGDVEGSSSYAICREVDSMFHLVLEGK